MRIEPKSYTVKSIVCHPGAKMTIVLSPQGIFKPELVLMEIAGGPFTCTSIRVGHVEQMSGARVPCEIFAATGRRADGRLTSDALRLSLDTCRPAVSISVDVTNVGDVEGSIELQMDGVEVPGG